MPDERNGDGRTWPGTQLQAHVEVAPRPLPRTENWRELSVALGNVITQDHAFKRAIVEGLEYLKEGVDENKASLREVREWQVEQDRAHRGLEKRVARGELEVDRKIITAVRDEVAEQRESTRPDAPEALALVQDEDVRREPSYSDLDKEALRAQLQEETRRGFDLEKQIATRDAAIAAREALLREQAQEREADERAADARAAKRLGRWKAYVALMAPAAIALWELAKSYLPHH